MYSYILNGEVNAVLGIDVHPMECGGILLVVLKLKNTLLHLIGKDILFWCGLNKLPCDLIECTVVNN